MTHKPRQWVELKMDWYVGVVGNGRQINMWRHWLRPLQRWRCHGNKAKINPTKAGGEPVPGSGWTPRIWMVLWHMTEKHITFWVNMSSTTTGRSTWSGPEQTRPQVLSSADEGWKNCTPRCGTSENTQQREPKPREPKNHRSPGPSGCLEGKSPLWWIHSMFLWFLLPLSVHLVPDSVEPRWISSGF